MAVWDRVAAAVTHRRSWAIALLIAVGAGVFIALAGPNAGADKAPLQLPPSAESARAAALLRTFPGEDQQPAILVASRRDEAPLTPTDMAAAESARQRVLSRATVPADPPLIASQDGREGRIQKGPPKGEWVRPRRAGRNARARHPRRHRAGGVGDRSGDHQRGHSDGRGFLCTCCASADSAHPTRRDRRAGHRARHVHRAHRRDPRAIHGDRTADLVARQSRRHISVNH